MLLKGMSDVPAGLDVRVINSWLSGTAREISEAHLSFVMTELFVIAPTSADEVERGAEAPPDFQTTQGRKMAVTRAMRDQVRSELRRTGLSSSVIADLDATKAIGLTEAIITKLRSGACGSIASEQWDYLSSYLESQPDRPTDRGAMSARYSWGRSKDSRPITDEEFAALTQEKDRTGMGGARLLAYAENPPPGLTAAMIGGWLNQTSRSASPTHLDFVLSLYRSLPTRIKPHGRA
jgi:hypothetical protein